MEITISDVYIYNEMCSTPFKDIAKIDPDAYHLDDLLISMCARITKLEREIEELRNEER